MSNKLENKWIKFMNYAGFMLENQGVGLVMLGKRDYCAKVGELPMNHTPRMNTPLTPFANPHQAKLFGNTVKRRSHCGIHQLPTE